MKSESKKSSIVLGEEAKIAFNYIMADWLGSADNLMEILKLNAEEENLLLDDYLIAIGARVMLREI